MGYFALEDGVSTSPLDGALEISEAQYHEAMSAIMSGRQVTIDGGFAVRDKQPSEHHDWENGAWVDKTPEPEPRPLTALDVDIEHDRRANEGKTFTVDGYGDIPLEGSLRTQTVLLALKDTARDLQAAEITAPVLFLTDRDNGDHNLTPEQVIALVDQGKAFMQALHEAKRALKAITPIPADYTADSYWP
ncbi:hypothetical protein [Pseudorhizobium pelagicum]|uniref:DUF4376 domain-containing protein n=1 Tax=Pseudorhizobium pelagicum TaxID=1509405 RepID=A0A922TBY9_9HYPH|nr:hypothetical protein [Pseudorhizobium pelagicum]KEQ07016.1 hypothetical protein GV67_22535 [Pseudorhizobium pelagicum]KEQ09961.1 hypothetical protein GV68_18325 [Pseudorhizobium pelagicum]